MVSKIRTDSRQDSDRPHYYSQFWIDVAMGKQSPALPEAQAVAEEEEEEDLEADLLAVAPKPEPKAKAPKPAEKKPETRPTITSLADLANIDMLMRSSAAMDDTEAPDITAGLGAAAGPDITLVVAGEEEEAEASESEEVFEEGFDEEEEEDEWGGSRRKPKPGKAKRHERREF